MNTILKFRAFVKNQILISLLTILLIISCFFVPPDNSYIGYINFESIVVLFCLMGIVAGLAKINVLHFVTDIILKESHSSKIIAIILVNLCFFLSIFITNDVALITLVPLTIAIFKPLRAKVIIFVLTMETIAANLGGMLLPTGNPHNIFLFSYYQMNITDFFATVLPIAIISYILIMTIMIFMKTETLHYKKEVHHKITHYGHFTLYVILFALVILSVLKIIDYRIILAAAALGFLIADRSVFKKIDYGLLVTFLLLFVLVGNIQRIDIIRTAVDNFIAGKEFFATVLVSQFFSNVPAVMMLSGFTNNARALILGSNIGGLGTIIASMASLITYELYVKSEGARRGKFLVIFSVYNFAILILLCVAAILI